MNKLEINRDFELPFGLLIDDYESLANMKLPDIGEFQKWKDFKDRRILLNDDITEELIGIANFVVEWNRQDKGIAIADRKPIYIYINSYGGSLDAANAFIDVLKLSKTPIKLINMGQACSAAALIFMCKTENIQRIMLPTARVLIHQGQTGIGGQTNSVLDVAQDIKNSEKKIKEYVLDNTKINPKLYDKKRRVEWCLYSKSSLELGICDKIANDIDELY